MCHSSIQIMVEMPPRNRLMQLVNYLNGNLPNSMSMSNVKVNFSLLYNIFNQFILVNYSGYKCSQHHIFNT